MAVWQIRGGNRLAGSVRAQGAKNAVLPIMAASILSGCRTELLNCPRLSDVDAAADILRSLGCSVKREDDIINIDSESICSCAVSDELMREMRSSVLFLGAVLARCGSAELSLPGGCELGPRPIDLHLDALRALGAEIHTDGGRISCRGKELRGAEIVFPTVSVGATENAMIAACGAKGRTVIRNAAREPEIVDLQKYLSRLGARIYGAGTSVITIDGFVPEKAVGHRIMPDRIEAATFMCAAASAGGDVEILGAGPENFSAVTDVLSSMGCDIHIGNGNVRIKANDRLGGGHTVSTQPYPGFPTDAQPLLMAACLKSTGDTVFRENIFENRFRHVEALRRFGGDISAEGRTAVVRGVAELHGSSAVTTDLRGGAAMVIAVLGAQGCSEIIDHGHIDRGYDGLDIKLSGLGADIQKIV